MSATATILREITVNGSRITTRAATLAELIDEQGFATAKVATAVDGEFVPERRRAETVLAEGARIEIVSARQGG